MEAFLNMLFAEAVAEDRRLCVFTLPDRRTRHFSSLTAAALHAVEEAKTKEVYFGVGLAGRNFGRKNAAADVAVIGIGNLLLGDDGLGVHAARALAADAGWDGRVRIIDGGTDPWAALAAAGELLEAYPDSPEAAEVRSTLRTLTDNARIEEVRELRDEIRDLLSRRRYAEALACARDLVRRFPTTAAAEELRSQMARLEELARSGGETHRP